MTFKKTFQILFLRVKWHQKNIIHLRFNDRPILPLPLNLLIPPKFAHIWSPSPPKICRLFAPSPNKKEKPDFVTHVTHAKVGRQT